ncbi:hypothetical protein GRI75_09290 [Altererythrobacter soli]|uniref:Uncharacterized protein n=1 Tax=Croceibacterium soli TaxID=1739690 RepID=A0A6I4UWC2_9SPHN|nr:hypothetical protein [Croceibacterium soli]MXP41833.1 hypothetical protein [Croceibacterium soli]
MALTRFLAPLVPLALLAACGDEPAADGDGRSASGQVLEGTISDDMLPLDKLQSEPPLLAPELAPSRDGARGEAGEAGAAGGTPDEAEPAGDEPAEAEASQPEPEDEPAAG